MSLRIRTTSAVGLFASFLAACSGSNPSTGPSNPTTIPAPASTATTSATATNTTDTGFVLGAGESSNSEIADANLALSKSQNPDVIAFAQKMIADHTGENQALAPIGTQIGDPAPTGVSSLMQQESANLANFSGTAFDAEYINSEINGHQMNLANNYIPELQLGINTLVKGYAGTYQPQVQSHLTLALSIKAKYGF